MTSVVRGFVRPTTKTPTQISPTPSHRRGEAMYRTLVPRYRNYVEQLLAPVEEEDRRLLAALCERLNRTLQCLSAGAGPPAGVREDGIR